MSFFATAVTSAPAASSTPAASVVPTNAAKRSAVDLAFQGTLLGWELPAVDQRFCGAVRVELAPDAWVDHVPGWVIGADALLETVVELVAWQSPMVRMWDKQVQTPRLSGALAEGE